MSIGAAICLVLIIAQLTVQTIVAVRAVRQSHAHPEPTTTSRRDYLDRKAEVERDARKRL